VLWQRFGDGAPLEPRLFDAAAIALGDAMASREFEILMMSEAHLRSAGEIAKAQSRARPRGRRTHG
jgi:hypothetical protein